MNRPVLLVPLVLVAVGATLWWALGDAGEPGIDAADPSAAVGTDGPTPALLRGERDPESGGPRTGPNTPRPEALKPVRLRKGALDVLPLGPDDLPIHADTITVKIRSGERQWPHSILGMRDRESGLWSFKKVPIGKVLVTVFGDHVVETTVEVRVREGTTTYQKVYVDRAGAVRYNVKLYDGTQPEQVTLSLRDARGKPARAIFQMRGPRHLTSPRSGTSMTQGPTGIVFGLAPGRYTLRATSPSGESDDVEILAEVGLTTDVEIELRR